jgi:hypothetical protein
VYIPDLNLRIERIMDRMYLDVPRTDLPEYIIALLGTNDEIIHAQVRLDATELQRNTLGLSQQKPARKNWMVSNLLLTAGLVGVGAGLVYLARLDQRSRTAERRQRYLSREGGAQRAVGHQIIGRTEEQRTADSTEEQQTVSSTSIRVQSS